ncbi:MAG: hypothetical protein QE271_10615 [Bacteriovoracaceae bacterium]|nr:hypothetical protein [Bacteriovoracaceae bacterium]
MKVKYTFILSISVLAVLSTFWFPFAKNSSSEEAMQKNISLMDQQKGQEWVKETTPDQYQGNQTKNFDYKNEILVARSKAPSLTELSKSYESMDDQNELKEEYNHSLELIKKLDLIGKANKEKLTSDELVILTTEMRKQGVIGLRLAELEFEKYEQSNPNINN